MAVVSTFDRSLVSTPPARLPKASDAPAQAAKAAEAGVARVDTVDLSPAAIAASQAQREIDLGLRSDIRVDKVAAARAAIARGAYDTDDRRLDIVADRLLSAISQLKD